MNDIAETLTALHRELDRLRPAVEYMDAARHAVDAAKAIPAQHQAQLDKHLKSLQETLDAISDLLVTTVEEVDKRSERLVVGLRESYDEAGAAVARRVSAAVAAVAAIPDQHQQILDAHLTSLETKTAALEAKLATGLAEWSDRGDRLVDSLRRDYDHTAAEVVRRVDDAKTVVASVSEGWRSESQALVDNLRDQHQVVGKAVLDRTDALVTVRQAISDYYDRLNGIDFPTRLDKLDASVSGIQSGLQTTQQRVDLLEQSVRTSQAELKQQLSTELKALSNASAQRHAALLAEMESKRTTALWALAVCFLLATAVGVMHWLRWAGSIS